MCLRSLLVLLVPCFAVAADGAAPRIDHHQHLLAPEMAAEGQKPIDAAAMIGMLDEAGIERAVLLSNAYRNADAAKVKAENDWTAGEAAKYPRRLVAFCGFDPLADYALAELARCAADERFGRGIKLQFGMSAVNLADAAHVTHGSDGGDPTDPPPRAMLEAFRKLPLSEAEFRAIEGNRAPYLR